MASHSPFCDYDMTQGGSHYTTKSLLKMDTVGMTIDLPPSFPPHPTPTSWSSSCDAAAAYLAQGMLAQRIVPVPRYGTVVVT